MRLGCAIATIRQTRPSRMTMGLFAEIWTKAFGRLVNAVVGVGPFDGSAHTNTTMVLCR